MLRYRIVDVFSERPFGGNPLCVVLDRCPDELMQQIAREVNLSETTFPVKTGEQSYEMRIFTPSAELSFAGHPSIGTAWLMGAGRWTQTTSGGTVIVEADERGAIMGQPAPEFEAVEAEADDVLSALGLSAADAVVRSTAGGLTHVLVPTQEPIDKLDLDLGRIAEVSRACRAFTLVPFRRVDDMTLQARVFGPAVGVSEDPGSGSAAGPIALLGRELWGTRTEVTITMGAEIGRPSRIDVQTEDELRVGGRVALCAEGQFAV
jgi:trans-2,3-dihydro-3-hydroxyanthranilate isomerase